MVVGNKAQSGFYLNTQSLSKDENLSLIKILRDKFDLNCTINKQGQNDFIYIRADSINKFKTLVRPYFHESMLYKLD